MNNKLIKKEGLWNRIKTFIKKVFKIKKINVDEDVTLDKNILQKSESKIPNNIVKIKEKTPLENIMRKENLAKQLLNKEIDIFDLEDDECDEMIDFFKKDIEQKDKEIEKIKNHILEMKIKLSNK